MTVEVGVSQRMGVLSITLPLFNARWADGLRTGLHSLFCFPIFSEPNLYNTKSLTNQHQNSSITIAPIQLLPARWSALEATGVQELVLGSILKPWSSGRCWRTLELHSQELPQHLGALSGPQWNYRPMNSATATLLGHTADQLRLRPPSLNSWGKSDCFHGTFHSNPLESHRGRVVGRTLRKEWWEM